MIAHSAQTIPDVRMVALVSLIVLSGLLVPTIFYMVHPYITTNTQHVIDHTPNPYVTIDYYGCHATLKITMESFIIQNVAIGLLFNAL